MAEVFGDSINIVYHMPVLIFHLAISLPSTLIFSQFTELITDDPNTCSEETEESECLMKCLTNYIRDTCECVDTFMAGQFYCMYDYDCHV